MVSFSLRKVVSFGIRSILSMSTSLLMDTLIKKMFGMAKWANKLAKLVVMSKVVILF